jgi:hypothetical protein
MNSLFKFNFLFSRLDIEKECKRLVIGFRETIGKSEVKRTINEMTTILSTPSWQKSTFWVVCFFILFIIVFEFNHLPTFI